MGSKILGSGMNDGHGGVCTSCLLEHHIGNWFTNDVGASNHNNFRTFGLHTRANDHLLDARRGAWCKFNLGSADHQPPHIHRMKSVHILVRIDGVEYFFLVNPFGKRQLNKDSINGVILIVFLYQGKQRFL